MENQTAKNKGPDLSLILPAFNEESIIQQNVGILYEYLKGINKEYSFEIIVINDGSTDRTGELIDKFAEDRSEIRVIHHPVNLNLGSTLKSGFAHARGRFTITFDMDLSYSPDHIRMILDTLIQTKADIVIASPYMKGGRVTAVPFYRKSMSRWANRFMRFAAQQKFHTYTSMVRGYRTEYIQSLNLKTTNFEINPEILYKSMILRARMVEIPAHLDWTEQRKKGVTRTSGLRTYGTFLHSLMAGFIFRPYRFYLTVGVVLLLIAVYIIGWIFINVFQILPEVQLDPQFFDDRFSTALEMAFHERPHAFIVGGVVLMAAIQFISLGFISLQNKRYFEELFHISATLLKDKRNITGNNLNS